MTQCTQAGLGLILLKAQVASLMMNVECLQAVMTTKGIIYVTRPIEPPVVCV